MGRNGEATQLASFVVALEKAHPQGGMVMPSDATSWKTDRIGAVLVSESAQSAEERAIHIALETRGHVVTYGVSAARLYMYFRPRSPVMLPAAN